MKLVIASLMMISFACPAFAAKTFKGKCAKAAASAAITFWADVAQPDPSLEYFVVSSEPKAGGSKSYEVVLAISDGNQVGYAGYTVTFENLNKCSEPSVERDN